MSRARTGDRRALKYTTTIVAVVLAWACSNNDASSGAEGSPLDPPPSDPTLGSGGTAGPSTVEPELEENFRSPVVSGPYLWSSNPETNRVARIDARSFEIEVVDGGHGPTFLAAVPAEQGASGAAVINVFGDDVSIFRESTAMGGASGLVAETRLPVQPGASAWAVGRTGKFAIAWSRFEQDLRGPRDGYQDLTVLSLGGPSPKATRLSVGFRPTQVVINEQETHTFVVSGPGISVLDLSSEEPGIKSELFLPSEATGGGRDVSFTPDGAFAFVRLAESAEVLVIRTEDDVRVQVPLPARVTDLDLSGDGSIAVAVMRGELSSPSPPGNQGGDGGEGPSPAHTSSRIALLPVPTIFASPLDFDVVETDELVGSVVLSEDASRALLYTSAVDSSRLLILDLVNLSERVVDLQAPAQAAFISEDGSFAAAIMTPPSGSNSSGAFALFVANEDRPVRIEGTDTVPRFISLTDDRCLVTTWGSQTAPAVSYLGKFPDLSVDRIELPSAPLASGMVPEASQGFVAQTHPEGRVTFIDWETALPTTVTGFELSSKVVER